MTLAHGHPARAPPRRRQALRGPVLASVPVLSALVPHGRTSTMTTAPHCQSHPQSPWQPQVQESPGASSLTQELGTRPTALEGHSLQSGLPQLWRRHQTLLKREAPGLGLFPLGVVVFAIKQSQPGRSDCHPRPLPLNVGVSADPGDLKPWSWVEGSCQDASPRNTVNSLVVAWTHLQVTRVKLPLFFRKLRTRTLA